MVYSNIQRKNLLPSEKAFAYKMKLEAMKRQAGRPKIVFYIINEATREVHVLRILYNRRDWQNIL